MALYEQITSKLQLQPRKWLVTGVAGFVGSNLLETLLKLDQEVTGLDNFATGNKNHLEEVKALVKPGQWSRFHFVEGDIRNAEICRAACRDVECVLHQAALGSVPLSFAEPLLCHETNVTGFLNMLLAARDAHVARFVYASSSSVYGDDPNLTKVEEKIGTPLSPYAASKLMNEVYADVVARGYSIECIGLRYFNVFGPRQNPSGSYAAVVPKWITSLLRREQVYINGDGETSRDFCFVQNVVQANVLASATSVERKSEVYNIGSGRKTTLNELYSILNRFIHPGDDSASATLLPRYLEFREGDIRHSVADLNKSRASLGYEPLFGIEEGLGSTIEFFRRTSPA